MLSRTAGLVLFGLLLATSAPAQDTTSSSSPLSRDFRASVASLTLPQAQTRGSSSTSLPPSPVPRPPAFEIALGYVYTSFNPPGLSHNLNGGIGSVTYNLNHWLGVTAEFTGSAIGGLPSATDGTMYTYLFGPHLARRSERITPWVHSLFGVAHLNVDSSAPLQTGAFLASTLHQNAFAMALGGGFDVNLGKHLSWRLVEADYLFTRFTDNASNYQNSFRASTAVIVKLRSGPPSPPPNHPPIVSASADPSQVVSGDSAAIQAQANDPDNDILNYSWSATAGKVDGTGPQVRWASADAAPGRYTITVNVDDGRGGTASASADVTVVARPDRPPTVSVCAADPDTLIVGQKANITAAASDPDNDPLTYTYSATAGKVSGTGPQAQFDSAGLAPGPYAVICHVDDGKGATAESRAEIQVQEPPPPPQQKQLELRLSLHSIYFPTAQPTVHNPSGGLLASQQRTLITLANDFKQYLTFKPDARLILQGHADPRGGPEYNQALSDRRVQRTKAFLVQHGVAADHIDTQGLGVEQPMTSGQVKQAIDQAPNLTPAQKAQLTRNASILALAQNRRVDVTLSTTGQTSVRQFPFNAEDALNLINPKRAAKPAAPKGKKPPATKKRATEGKKAPAKKPPAKRPQ